VCGCENVGVRMWVHAPAKCRISCPDITILIVSFITMALHLVHVKASLTKLGDVHDSSTESAGL